jgi:8-oxo-dGTP pyrophosphatase MutT (NUDIX family)
MIVTLQDVQQALALPEFDSLAAHTKMMPASRTINRPPEHTGRPRLGGVLLLLYSQNGELYLVLTRRRDDLSSHAGQISFPGGRREEGEPLEMTALREAYEEIGVDPAELTILGTLSSLYIPPSDYEVHPFVAWHPGRPSLVPQEREVAEILEVPLSHLFNPATRQEEEWVIRDFPVRVPFLLVDQHRVWGATAMILSEFLERLRLVIEMTNDET